MQPRGQGLAIGCNPVIAIHDLNQKHDIRGARHGILHRNGLLLRSINETLTSA
ncbi:hypothetical protein NK6_6215 [Bradyrhizobium diazoefficiens]|uniref:Uncharacterized protein n=1 Tax=Bradyrhizobium diazoefficiens TaxID=1355477 RepID=A0A0E4FZW3_9BRAD|nr:hypothetical protein NK6_6215 [Bradyrhizobium diazoefficiens]